MHRLGPGHRGARLDRLQHRVSTRGQIGRGGWPETFEDVSDAIDALADVDGVDLHRVAPAVIRPAGTWRWGAHASAPPEVQSGPGRGGRVRSGLAGRGGGSRCRRTPVRRAGAVQALMGGDPDE